MTLLYLGIANGMISLCIAKSSLFEPLRTYIFNRNWMFLHGLISCPYCLSHWVAFAMTAIWLPRLTHSIALLDYMITMFVIVAIATLTWTITFGLQNWAEKE